MNLADRDAFPPKGVDLERPSVARVYDYLLDGHTNWAVDREFGDRAVDAFPLLKLVAKANRQFLFRAVRHLMRRGVRQFIDLGAGVPTMDHTHTVADRYEPGSARVVYVDNEPVAVAHAQVLLEQEGDARRHTAINGDLRAPHRIWEQVAGTELIDFDRPVALLMIAVLHVQQRDEDGRDIGNDVTAAYRELLPQGSYLAISHLTDDGVPPELNESLRELKKTYDGGGNPVIWRSRQQIADLFGNFELIDPGLTWTPLWHPEEKGSAFENIVFEQPSEAVIYAGVGRKP